MKAKHILSITICLGLILTFVSACKRGTVQEPSPFGPSSFAIVLQVSCSPNVIFAGEARQSTTVTATLKEFNGEPLNQKTVYFEVGDSSKKRQNVGYFEGNQTAVSRVTDENGVATINYIGPLAKEITTSGTIYIWATTAWGGKEFIDDNTPVEIIQKSLPAYEIAVSGNPNVLFAGATKREMSRIAVWLQLTGDGSTAPVANNDIHFWVGTSETDETQVNIGYFDNHKAIYSKPTDENGMVAVQYWGPLASEITQSPMTVYIWAKAAVAGQIFVAKSTPIQIIKDPLEAYELTIWGKPDVLFAGATKREMSRITVQLFTHNGSYHPVANNDIHFWVGTSETDETQVNIGYFDNHKAIYSKPTDKNGMVAVQYWGPLADEITQSPTIVYIWAKAAIAGPTFVAKSTPIQIIKDVTPLSFTAGAYPNVIYATGSTRPETKIRAEVKMGPKPVKGRRIFFSIMNNNPGYFPDNKKYTYRTTNDDGIAQITYYGPLASEIIWEQTIIIRVQLETSTPEDFQYIDVEVRVKKSG